MKKISKEIEEDIETIKSQVLTCWQISDRKLIKRIEKDIEDIDTQIAYWKNLAINTNSHLFPATYDMAIDCITKLWNIRHDNFELLDLITKELLNL